MLKRFLRHHDHTVASYGQLIKIFIKELFKRHCISFYIEKHDLWWQVTVITFVNLTSELNKRDIYDELHTAKQAIQYIISESKTGTVQMVQTLRKECWVSQMVAACALCAVYLISNLWAWCFPDSWYMDRRSKTVGVNNIRFVRNEIPAKLPLQKEN